ncbi:MAG: hypothetical protein U0441_18045, partial [Polyangiaceae bacterium]
PRLAAMEPTDEALRAMVPALCTSVLLLMLTAQVDAARRVLVRLESLSASGGPMSHAPVALARSWIAAWREGDAEAALCHARRARSQAEAAHDAHQARFARIFIGTAEWELGMLGVAEEELRAAGAVSGDDLPAAFASLFLAALLIEKGALAEAEALADKRLTRSRSGGAGHGAMREAEARWLLGEIALRRGDLHVAERELTAAVQDLGRAPLLWLPAACRLAEMRRATGEIAAAAELMRAVDIVRIEIGGPGIRVLELRSSSAPIGDEQPL